MSNDPLTPTPPLAEGCSGCSMPLSTDYEFMALTVETYVPSDRGNVWISARRKTPMWADRPEEILELTPAEARELAAALLRSANTADPEVRDILIAEPEADGTYATPYDSELDTTDADYREEKETTE